MPDLGSHLLAWTFWVVIAALSLAPHRRDLTLSAPPHRWAARLVWTLAWFTLFVAVTAMPEPGWAAGRRVPNLWFPDTSFALWAELLQPLLRVSCPILCVAGLGVSFARPGPVVARRLPQA